MNEGEAPVCYAEEGRHPLPASGVAAHCGTEVTFETRGGPPMPPCQETHVGRKDEQNWRNSERRGGPPRSSRV